MSAVCVCACMHACVHLSVTKVGSGLTTSREDKILRKTDVKNPRGMRAEERTIWVQGDPQHGRQREGNRDRGRKLSVCMYEMP